MKGLIIYILLGILAIATIAVCFFVVIKPSPNSSNQDSTIEIVCKDKIQIAIGETEKLEYFVKNVKERISIKFLVSGNSVSVSGDGYITASKVGVEVVTILVECGGKTYQKTITVTVLLSGFEATLKVADKNNLPVLNLFAGQEYYLIAECSKEIGQDYNVFVSNNIANVELIEKDGNVLKFSFTVLSVGESTLKFSYLDFETQCSYLAYEYVKDINVNFGIDLHNEVINLYLFNENLTDQANQDGYYNQCVFEVTENSNCINNYSVCVQGETAKIEGNKIIAIKNGECDFVVSANDGSNYQKSYRIVVQSINASELELEVEDEYNVGECYELEYNTIPSYSLFDIEFYVNNILVAGNKVEFDSEGSYTLKLIDTKTGIFVQKEIIVNSKLEYSFQIEFEEMFLTLNNAIFENDVLDINSNSENIEVYFSYKILSNINSLDISCDIAFTSQNVKSQIYTNANSVVLTLEGKGEAIVTLTNRQNELIIYRFKIVIN